MITRPVTMIELLTVMFIGLKITDQIDWSWWWVISPLWITPIVCVLFSRYKERKKLKSEGGENANTQA